MQRFNCAFYAYANWNLFPNSVHVSSTLRMLSCMCVVFRTFRFISLCKSSTFRIFTWKLALNFNFWNLKSHKLIDFLGNCCANTIKTAFTQYLYYSLEGYNLTLCIRTYWANNFKMSLYLPYQGKHRRYLPLIYFQYSGTTFVPNLNWHFGRLNVSNHIIKFIWILR